MQVLKQDIQDNKPLIDKLNKTGLALTKMALKPNDLELVTSTMDDDNKRVDGIRRAVRERSMSIDEALQQSAEVRNTLCVVFNQMFFICFKQFLWKFLSTLIQ